MGLLAFKEEFDEFVQTLPAPVDIPVNDNQLATDPDKALRSFNEVMHAWWAGMVRSLDQYRSMVERSGDLDGDRSLRFAVDHGVPYLVAQIDRVIALLDSGAPLAINGTGRRRYAKKHKASFQRHMARAHRLRDAALAIAWDFDPDARGGVPYENVDDLIASLN